MNLTDITYTLRSLAKRILTILKDTLKLPYVKTYIIISLITIVFFVVITFPYNILIRKQIMNLERTLFKSIYVGVIDFSLIDICTINNLYITTKKNNEISIKRMYINASVNPITLFFNEDIKGDFEIKDLNYSSDKVQFSLNVNGNADINMDNNFDVIKEGIINLIIQNVNIKISELKIPSKLGDIPINFPKIRASIINFNSNIKNKNLVIKRLTISGPDLNGSIKGSVKIANFFNNSLLNLTILIDSNSKIINDYKDFLKSYIDSGGKIKITLTGSIANPKFKTDSKSDIRSERTRPDIESGRINAQRRRKKSIDKPVRRIWDRNR